MIIVPHLYTLMQAPIPVAVKPSTGLPWCATGCSHSYSNTCCHQRDQWHLSPQAAKDLDWDFQQAQHNIFSAP